VDGVSSNWLELGTHRNWLLNHAGELLSFGRRSPKYGVGALWLDEQGQPVESQPIHTWITARMTYVYSLGSLLGVPGCATLAARAMSGLTGPLHDDRHGGWYSTMTVNGPEQGKLCYDHVFVLLAASTAVQAELDGADGLFQEAADTLLDRFWDDSTGLCVDRWDTNFEHCDPYRGINSNMHAVEAMLAAAGVSDERQWLDRALHIAEFVAGQAGANQWRIPEHYDETWEPMLQFNLNRPADQFRPFGATPGHGFEWSRLMLHLANGLLEVDDHGLVDAACALFDRAAADGWAPDGRPGFVYTTDWDGHPVVSDRLHWVTAEAIGAAVVQYHETGQERYAELYRRWWDYAATFLLDHENGSWRHQLDEENQPIDTVWAGKPDVYHAFQATLVPLMPLYPMPGAALASGLADPGRVG
jgi:mannose/cellobiose epimerase-like protein (N-acyl-D-glucosamine 2-epimerase family)